MKPYRSILNFAILSMTLLPCGPALAILAPQLHSPINNSEITDIASHFKWAPISGVSNWEIQIATDAGFSSMYRAKTLRNQRYHDNTYFPRDVLPAGIYWWRVRGVDGAGPGPWSAAFSVKVNAVHSISENLIMPISTEKPVFFMRNRDWNPAPTQNQRFVKDIIPPGFEQVIIPDDIAMTNNIGNAAIARAKVYESLGINFVFWDNRSQTPLSVVEYVFQNFKHCIGLAEGEHFSGWDWEKGPEGNPTDNTYVLRAYQLCAKYGRYYIHGEGEGFRYPWTYVAQDLREEYAKYRRNVLPMFKTTLNAVAPHTYGSVQGLMASGYVDHIGLWGDEFNWRESGFGPGANPPWAYMVQHWLMSIAGGGTVFHLESAHQWRGDGSGSASYVSTYLPFVKAVLSQGLIPSRKAFLDSLKVAVVGEYTIAKLAHNQSLNPAFPFLNTLYDIKREPIKEMIMDNSRYGVICILPPGSKSLNPNTKIYPRAELLDNSRALQVFNQAYPERFKGDAFMWECDGRFIAMNVHEDRALENTYDMPLNSQAAIRITGRLDRHKYLIGRIKDNGNSLFLHVNGGNGNVALNTSAQDTRSNSTLNFSAPLRPALTVTPPSALLNSVWSNSTLTVTLSHAAGAVNVEIRNPNASSAILAAAAPEDFAMKVRENILTYRVPQGAGTASRIRISAFDSKGRKAVTLVDRIRKPGHYSVPLTNSRGAPLEPGTYLFRMEGPGFSESTKIEVLKQSVH